jgi:hypothetical protein
MLHAQQLSDEGYIHISHAYGGPSTAISQKDRGGFLKTSRPNNRDQAFFGENGFSCSRDLPHSRLLVESARPAHPSPSFGRFAATLSRVENASVFALHPNGSASRQTNIEAYRPCAAGTASAAFRFERRMFDFDSH